MTDHRVDAQKLTADGIVYLFKIELASGGTIYLKADNTVTWQGNVYEGTAIKMDGVSNSVDDGNSRPKLQFANPDGAFSPFISQGSLDRAKVTRTRVLYDDLVNNRNVSSSQSWYVSRTIALNRQYASLELRLTMDGPFFVVPARIFAPPDFPSVSIR
ncbi:phage minor tail protein L [Inquilinus limosus]|uniref:Uncharacterized protein n=1 Tax=Inquilinus limosus MP06 TaxID=1398085 RepID=A0A0A0DBN0_9PROT|nr:hypothetical protein [Inquilinus limosus]KGM36126.1 hypothetical protein P409_00325 [Inquilinus limosus MP06]